MKPSPSILIVVALYAFIAGNATPKVTTAPICARMMAVLHGQPVPIVDVRLAGATLVFELGVRSAGHRTALAEQPVIVRLIVSRSGKTEFTILSHNLRLAIPYRSV